jgi:hypothetical protein
VDFVICIVDLEYVQNLAHTYTAEDIRMICIYYERLVCDEYLMPVKIRQDSLTAAGYSCITSTVQIT